jgi:hypothetical protein
MVCGLLSIGCWGLKAHLIGWIHAIMLGPDYAAMCLYDFSVLAISLYAMQIFMSFAIYPTFEHMIDWVDSRYNARSGFCWLCQELWLNTFLLPLYIIGRAFITIDYKYSMSDFLNVL